jgi:hypothetical protein
MGKAKTAATESGYKRRSRPRPKKTKDDVIDGQTSEQRDITDRDMLAIQKEAEYMTKPVQLKGKSRTSTAKTHYTVKQIREPIPTNGFTLKGIGSRSPEDLNALVNPHGIPTSQLLGDALRVNPGRIGLSTQSEVGPSYTMARPIRELASAPGAPIGPDDSVSMFGDRESKLPPLDAINEFRGNQFMGEIAGLKDNFATCFVNIKKQLDTINKHTAALKQIDDQQKEQLNLIYSLHQFKRDTLMDMEGMHGELSELKQKLPDVDEIKEELAALQMVKREHEEKLKTVYQLLNGKLNKVATESADRQQRLQAEMVDLQRQLSTLQRQVGNADVQGEMEKITMAIDAVGQQLNKEMSRGNRLESELLAVKTEVDQKVDTVLAQSDETDKKVQELNTNVLEGDKLEGDKLEGMTTSEETDLLTHILGDIDRNINVTPDELKYYMRIYNISPEGMGTIIKTIVNTGNYEFNEQGLHRVAFKPSRHSPITTPEYQFPHAPVTNLTKRESQIMASLLEAIEKTGHLSQRELYLEGDKFEATQGEMDNVINYMCQNNNCEQDMDEGLSKAYYVDRSHEEVESSGLAPINDVTEVLYNFSAPARLTNDLKNQIISNIEPALRSIKAQLDSSHKAKFDENIKKLISPIIRKHTLDEFMALPLIKCYLSKSKIEPEKFKDLYGAIKSSYAITSDEITNSEGITMSAGGFGDIPKEHLYKYAPLIAHNIITREEYLNDPLNESIKSAGWFSNMFDKVKNFFRRAAPIAKKAVEVVRRPEIRQVLDTVTQVAPEKYKPMIQRARRYADIVTDKVDQFADRFTPTQSAGITMSAGIAHKYLKHKKAYIKLKPLLHPKHQERYDEIIQSLVPDMLNEPLNTYMQKARPYIEQSTNVYKSSGFFQDLWSGIKKGWNVITTPFRWVNDKIVKPVIGSTLGKTALTGVGAAFGVPNLGSMVEKGSNIASAVMGSGVNSGVNSGAILRSEGIRTKYGPPAADPTGKRYKPFRPSHQNTGKRIRRFA